MEEKWSVVGQSNWSRAEAWMGWEEGPACWSELEMDGSPLLEMELELD